MHRSIVLAVALAPLCAAFSPSGLSLVASSTSRASASICSVKAQATEGSTRRSFLAAGLALAGGAIFPTSVFAQEAAAPVAEAPAAAPSGEKLKLTGVYQDDVNLLLVSMKAATSAKKGDADMKAVVLKARADMNEFVAFYRRNTKVAGAASFSTLYTAISTLSGHFQNYGPEYPVPSKRSKRLLQQYAEIEKQISRGR